MLHQIFTVFDSKTAAYLPPMYMQTKPAMIRALTDTVNDPSHQFHLHPEDYTLFYLGSFNDENAVFDLEKSPVALATCLELMAQQPALGVN